MYEIQYVDLHVFQSMMVLRVIVSCDILLQVFPPNRSGMCSKSPVKGIPCLSNILFGAYLTGDAENQITAFTGDIHFAGILSFRGGAGDMSTLVQKWAEITLFIATFIHVFTVWPSALCLFQLWNPRPH